MYFGNSCDAPWARLSPGRELANLLEDVLQAGLAQVFPVPGDCGEELADLIAAQQDAAGLVELANACRKQAARFQVLELAAQTEYRRRRRAGDCWGSYLSSEIDRFISQEISAATATSPAAVDTALAVGQDLEDRLPGVREAMLHGGADFAKAKAIGELTRLIKDPDILAEAQERAVEWACGNTSTRLRHNLRKLVKKLDPEAVQERKRRSVAMRSLQLWDNDDETATLAGVNLDPVLAGRAYERINEIAKARRSAGDERTLDNLRADTLIGLILDDSPPDSGGNSPGGGPGHTPGGEPGDGPCGSNDDGSADGNGDPAGEPYSGPGPGEAPGDAPGHGNPDGKDTSPPDGTPAGLDATASEHAQARAAARNAAHVLSQLARGTSAAAIATHALRIREQAGGFPGCVSAVMPDGAVVHGNPTYRPPGSMQKKIEQRDLVCRYPNCNRKARHCDIDHGIPYDRDGPTCLCNLHAVCRGHHRQKQLPGWHLVDIYPGVVCWVAPSGHWYITTPGIEAD